MSVNEYERGCGLEDDKWTSKLEVEEREEFAKRMI